MFEIVVFVLALIASPLIIALFIKKNYLIQREITINQPINLVFDYIKHFKNQEKYNKWITADPDVKIDYLGEDGVVGYISKWDSKIKSVGKGEQEIVKINENVELEYIVRFEKPFRNTTSGSFTVEKITEYETKVIWKFGGKIPYPMNIMQLALSMDKILGSDIEISLKNLKSNLE